MASIRKKGMLFRSKLSETCTSCEAQTKYHCISCNNSVCVREGCSKAELNEETPGWEAGKKVGYCLFCYTQAAVLEEFESGSSDEEDQRASKLKRQSGEVTKSSAEVEDDMLDDLQDDKEEEEAAKKPAKKKADKDKTKGKSGRKSFWKEYHITDMVNIIVNDENILRKLLFTNTKKQCNTDAYEQVLKRLNAQYSTDGKESFPFTVYQMRTKFKWCVGRCKHICLTVKTASGVTRTIEEKGYGKWFDLLYPLVKTRDSCQPDQAIEPSASTSTSQDVSLSEGGDCSSLEDNVSQSKGMFVPIKRKKSSKKDNLTKTVELLQKAIENDPTKELIEMLRDDIKEAREQEMKYFQMIFGNVAQTPMAIGNQTMGNQTMGNQAMGNQTMGNQANQYPSVYYGQFPGQYPYNPYNQADNSGETSTSFQTTENYLYKDYQSGY